MSQVKQWVKRGLKYQEIFMEVIKGDRVVISMDYRDKILVFEAKSIKKFFSKVFFIY